VRPLACNCYYITYGLFRRQLKGHIFREAITRHSVTSDMQSHTKTLTYLLTYCAQFIAKSKAVCALCFS